MLNLSILTGIHAIFILWSSFSLLSVRVVEPSTDHEVFSIFRCLIFLEASFPVLSLLRYVSFSVHSTGPLAIPSLFLHRKTPSFRFTDVEVEPPLPDSTVQRYGARNPVMDYSEVHSEAIRE